MERNADNTLDNLAKDIRLLLLSFCDARSAIRLSQTSKSWYECLKITRDWKQIYFNTFSESRDGVEDWKEELKHIVALLGNVKICCTSSIDPPVELKPEEDHIHRTLNFIVNGRLLPSMGYFGPNDVCYGDWIKKVFEPLFQKFRPGANCTHYWDVCDQGITAFQFVKDGPICKLSIVIQGFAGEGPADPEWQKFTFLIEDLRAEYIKFLEELQRELLTNYGNEGQKFWNSLNIDWTKYK